MNLHHDPGLIEPLPLFHGGPLYRLMSWLGLQGCSKRQVLRRAFFWVLVSWIPVFVLAGLGSVFFPAQETMMSIFSNFALHVRCLVAIPVLVAAECYVDRRISGVIPLFVIRGLIGPDLQPALEKVESLIRKLVNSNVFELLLLLASFGIVAKRLYINLPSEVTSWKNLEFLPFVIAREWNQWIGLPIYYFLVFRWIWRFLLWCFFMLRLANLKLDLQGLHPDQMGGLAFLIGRNLKFGLVVLALSSVASANIGESVVYGGMEIEAFYLPMLVYVVIVEIVLLTPLLVFTPLLARVKRENLILYGNFSNKYVNQFKRKWLVSNANVTQDSLGTGDISSIADLGSSYSSHQAMKVILINRNSLVTLAVLTVSPLLPLLLFKIPLLDLLAHMAKLIV